jgi:hypothetical protein
MITTAEYAFQVSVSREEMKGNSFYSPICQAGTCGSLNNIFQTISRDPTLPDAIQLRYLAVPVEDAMVTPLHLPGIGILPKLQRGGREAPAAKSRRSAAKQWIRAPSLTLPADARVTVQRNISSGDI